MPAEKPFIECDYTEIELRVLGWMTDPAAQRQCRLAEKEECLNALMTPTGRRRSQPEMQFLKPGKT